MHAAQQERPDVAEARAAWRQAQPSFDISRLVFIDETWAKDMFSPDVWGTQLS